MKLVLFLLSLSAMALMLIFAQRDYRDDPLNQLIYFKQTEKCRDETNADFVEIVFVLDRRWEVPSSPTGKCFLNCWMRDQNLISDKGFEKDKYMEGFKNHLKDEAQIQLREELANECEDKRDPNDKCETAYLVMKCLDDGAVKRGIVID